MPAYIIARIDVTDPEDYAAYARQTVALAESFGGRFLVKGGAQTVVEGDASARQVVVEFPDVETARAWYDSPGYQAILPIALRASKRDLVIVEGA
ncbi:hypothetical protein AL036_19220 [Salipiger aestuarii]|uniref:Uncharacterized protein (DUF1330 family) n=1 Tax=Salipiger aestuarii TaxID=568098 RepID=A0A327XMB1_9RHOB|nr:DUF1330 domain-containing protein [Salipiger aestuarii]EIE48743.1 hypothetical protein C357_22360 [Citreicella sp. 357]KAA8605416.1 hypothetical protein AL036_19220 [Salipiger aestuarii]KAA8607279.1 hypothetical protein AL037_19060 [Salipiger aestuarii]KAB2538929.1 hypothetical protein AL035_18725 [Salipiger aestuarii]RAK09923.1 uncharacterized protein (DUF1330 family) [Salipiger aestuarii]